MLLSLPISEPRQRPSPTGGQEGQDGAAAPALPPLLCPAWARRRPADAGPSKMPVVVFSTRSPPNPPFPRCVVGGGPFPPLLRPGGCAGAELFPPKPSPTFWAPKPLSLSAAAQRPGGGWGCPAGPAPGAAVPRGEEERGEERPLPAPPGRASQTRAPAGRAGSGVQRPRSVRARRWVCSRNPALKPGFGPRLLTLPRKCGSFLAGR